MMIGEAGLAAADLRMRAIEAACRLLASGASAHGSSAGAARVLALALQLEQSAIEAARAADAEAAEPDMRDLGGGDGRGIPGQL